MTLDEITQAVLTISPQLLDPREAAALVESCGMNDRIAKSDLDMLDTFAVGSHIVRHNRVRGRVVTNEPAKRTATSFAQEARIAAQKFSVNFAYALPWALLLVVDYLNPNLLRLSPQSGGVLSLTLIASLIIAGGFSQAIMRIGYFYIGMKEPKLALRMCLLFLKWGSFTSLALATAGFFLAYYFRLFEPVYLAWGCVNFLLLSALWMFCAMLSVQSRVWRIPLVFVLGGAMFALLHHRFGVLIPITAADATSLICASAFSVLGFRRLPSAAPRSAPAPPLPRLSVISIMLLPFFLYGPTYFAFLFADRIAAGSAIPWASGLSFGIDSQYKQGMDVALCIFLVLAAMVEYLADRFTRYWFRVAEEVVDIERLLRAFYRRSLFAVCMLFAPLSLGLWLMYQHFQHKVLLTAVLGSLGYFFVALALFNLIVLFSVNCAYRALEVLSIALVFNCVIGYTFGHVFGVEFAPIGLLAGGLVLFICSYRAIRTVLERADYYYALA